MSILPAGGPCLISVVDVLCISALHCPGTGVAATCWHLCSAEQLLLAMSWRGHVSFTITGTAARAARPTAARSAAAQRGGPTASACAALGHPPSCSTLDLATGACLHPLECAALLNVTVPVLKLLKPQASHRPECSCVWELSAECSQHAGV